MGREGREAKERGREREKERERERKSRGEEMVRKTTKESEMKVET